MPEGRTLRPRWIIAARLSDAWIAKSHGKQGNLRRIEKNSPVNSEPITQPFAARVVPGHTRQMNFSPRRLTDNQKPCRACELHDRPRTERQVRLTNPAGAHVSQSSRQVSGISLHHGTEIQRLQVNRCNSFAPTTAYLQLRSDKKTRFHNIRTKIKDRQTLQLQDHGHPLQFIYRQSIHILLRDVGMH